MRMEQSLYFDPIIVLAPIMGFLFGLLLNSCEVTLVVVGLVKQNQANSLVPVFIAPDYWKGSGSP